MRFQCVGVYVIIFVRVCMGCRERTLARVLAAEEQQRHPECGALEFFSKSAI